MINIKQIISSSKNVVASEQSNKNYMIEETEDRSTSYFCNNKLCMNKPCKYSYIKIKKSKINISVRIELCQKCLDEIK